MAPVVNRLKSEYEGRVNVRILQGGDNGYAELSQRYGIQYVPTFVFVGADGSQRGDAIVGEVDESELRVRLDALE